MTDPSQTLSPVREGTAPILLVDPTTADAATWGGKGAALARLHRAGLPVPPLVVLTPAALDASLTDGERAALAAGEASALDEVVPSRAVRDAIGAALAALGHPPHVAVRSSAPDEDGVANAFAGQFASFLFVPPDRVPDRVADVWRSACTPHVAAYRAARGLTGPPTMPAVVLQAMVDADAAGVAFGADPVTGDRGVAVVAAVHGLASALVDGRAEGETLHVDVGGTVRRRTEGAQSVADRFDAAHGEGTHAVPVAPGRVLSDGQAARVADLARTCAEHLGGLPQDIEWALIGDTLWLVQSRPITTLPDEAMAEVDGRIRLWDNSNIVESYGGVTTPLTFSFARRAYEAVYREFCRLMRVPEDRVAAERETFAEMIGLVRGRVYYNLGSWYRVLALLPGYRLNAPLMEGMMGVTEAIPDALRPEPARIGRLADAWGLARSLVGLVRAHVGLARRSRAFYERLDRALAVPSETVAAMPLDALARHYCDVERDLLTQWDAPLVNDFFAMIWFGIGSRLADRWIGPGALGGLLAGQGDVVSAEPARRVEAMAALVADDPDLATALQTEAADAVRARLADHPVLDEAVAAYLDRFGDRCLGELKLESPTLHDDPSPLFRSIGAAAARGVPRDARPDPSDATSRAAQARAAVAFRGHPLRRFLFGWVARHAGARVRDRENLRFERTRVFGRARRIVVAMGHRLTEAGRLDEPRDVFWLELAELLGACDGTGTTADLRGLAAVRRAEFGAYRAGPAPPDRFTTEGAVALSPLRPTATTLDHSADGEVRDGLGCCPGVVVGTVRVVRDPRGVTLAPGTILVAERTDPGWILLFPACAGLVVARGSLLSHSAIVARELGLPCAVAVPGATEWLADGDTVRLDGATGRVERVGWTDA